MLRSLFSAISGLRNNQTKLDVIGNNIANVNTTAFKSNRVNFQDLFSQTISGASAPSATSLGGSNAKQVGLGMQLGSISTNMIGGSLQGTGFPFDFAISGEGFFVVSNQYPTDGVDPNYEFISADPSDIPKYYTRDGAFDLDYEGNLVTAGGFRVLGYLMDEGAVTLPDGVNHLARMSTDKEDIALPNTDPDAAGRNIYPINIPLEIIPDGGDSDAPVKLQDFSVDKTGLIRAVYGDTTYYLGYVAMSTFSNSAGLEKIGNNMYQRSSNSGEPEYGLPTTPGFGEIRQGFLEMSNVDLATEFTEMIITSRAYQANSRVIRTSDEMLQELVNIKR